MRQQCVGSAGKDGCFSPDVAGAATVAPCCAFSPGTGLGHSHR